MGVEEGTGGEGASFGRLSGREGGEAAAAVGAEPEGVESAGSASTAMSGTPRSQSWMTSGEVGRLEVRLLRGESYLL